MRDFDVWCRIFFIFSQHNRFLRRIFSLPITGQRLVTVWAGNCSHWNRQKLDLPLYKWNCRFLTHWRLKKRPNFCGRHFQMKQSSYDAKHKGHCYSSYLTIFADIHSIDGCALDHLLCLLALLCTLPWDKYQLFINEWQASSLVVRTHWCQSWILV